MRSAALVVDNKHMRGYTHFMEFSFSSFLVLLLFFAALFSSLFCSFVLHRIDALSSLTRALHVQFCFSLFFRWIYARHIIMFHLRSGWLTGTLTVRFLIRVVRFSNCVMKHIGGRALVEWLRTRGDTHCNIFGYIVGWWIWLKSILHLFNLDSTLGDYRSAISICNTHTHTHTTCGFINYFSAIRYALDRIEIYN